MTRNLPKLLTCLILILSAHRAFSEDHVGNNEKQNLPLIKNYLKLMGFYYAPRRNMRKNEPQDLALIRNHFKLIDAILNIPEEEIDISKIAFLLARDIFSDLDLDWEYGGFIKLTREVKDFTGDRTDPEQRVRYMNTYLYRKFGIGYAKDDYQGRFPENRYIHTVINKKVGTCANMPILYIAIAQKLGYPVYAVMGPQHMFCRYLGLERENIEATSGGGWSSDDDYILDLEIKPETVKNGYYMRTLSDRELVAEMIVDHASFYYGRVIQEYDLGIEILHEITRLFPQTPPETWFLLGQLYLMKAQHIHPLDEYDNRAELVARPGKAYIKKAREMGLNPPLEYDYWKKPQPSKLRAGG